jgi:hypothetical protein
VRRAMGWAVLASLRDANLGRGGVCAYEGWDGYAIGELPEIPV